MALGAYELLYSLRAVLSTEVPQLTDVQMIYDGAPAMSDMEKPFATVQYLAENKTKLAAGRRSYEYAYRFQIGVYADSFANRLQLETLIDEALSAPNGVPLFNSQLLPTGDYVLCDVDSFTPIANEDLSNKTNNHHGYFDVSVFLLREFGSDEFTQ